LYAESTDRREEDRRKSRASFVWRERRTGFDRRVPAGGGAVGVKIDDLLRALRDRPQATAILLVVVNVLNLLDFGLTLNYLAHGGGEANPVMRSLFNVGPLSAGIFKFGAVLLVTALVWRYRRFRSGLAAAVAILLLYVLIIVYHIFGITLFM
jgi:hypothetical protein